MERMILSIVEAHRGIFSRELELIMSADAHPRELDMEKYKNTLHNMVIRGDVIECDYVIGEITGSVIFPKGTKVMM